MSLRIFLISAAMLALLASPAIAGHGYMHGGDQGFSSMDTNNDGVVTRDEYLAPFNEWDADEDGELSLEEWLSSHGGRKAEGHGYGKMNYPAMDAVDTDNDGKVSMEEFEAVYPGMSEGYSLLDLNKDGIVDGDEWEEFRRMHLKSGSK
jgi:hypothetical protein